MSDTAANSNGDSKAAKPAPPSPKNYTVLTPKAPYEVVLTGKYDSAAAAFQAAVAKTGGVQEGNTASYIVVASRFLAPRTAKEEVKRKLVFT